MVYINQNNDNSMFYGAPPNIFEKARELRNKLTKAENILWDKLKGKQLGVKFRRQHPIYIYIADFYCHAKKLIIEVDGDYHLKSEQKEYDELRSEDIKDLGIKVIRFSNKEVIEHTDSVINKIKEIIASRTPKPEGAGRSGHPFRGSRGSAGGQRGSSARTSLKQLKKKTKFIV